MMPFSSLKVFRELRSVAGKIDEEVLKFCIDALLADDDELEFVLKGKTLRNETAVDYILDSPFIIERSPPVLLSLRGAITATNLPVWIGTYMGWSVAPDHSVLLFVTIPGGIIAISSAIGLADALAAGLGASLQRLFK